MKKHLLTTLFLMVALFISSSKSNAQLALIHYWHFNNYNQGEMYTPTINAIPADYTDLLTTNPRILYTTLPGTSSSYSSYIDSLTAVAADFDTVNARLGQPPGRWVRARNPSDAMELLFYIPTTNFQNIVLKYGTESSSITHGQVEQVYSYSKDGGTTWITSGGLSVQNFLMDTLTGYNDTFRLATVTFTDTAGTNNNPNLIFRITFSGHDTGTSGNNRFDNVTVEGDSIGGTAVGHEGVTPIVNAAQHYTLYPNPEVNILNVIAASPGVKTVVIYNEHGESVYTGSKGGKLFSINTSALSPGNYYLNIHEMDAGDISTIKFVKQ